MVKDSQIYSFSNVHIRLMDKNMNITKEINSKNMVTKYALSGIAKMIRGEFNQTYYEGVNEYVPKYLAIGTNDPGVIDTSTTSGFVTSNDTMLCSEIVSPGLIPDRIRLEDVRRTDSTSSNDYIKIRYRSFVPSGFVSTRTKIRELGLFTKSGVLENNVSDIHDGLFARIVLSEPITIPDNSSMDVIWDIVLASSGVGVYPSVIDLWADDTKNPDRLTIEAEEVKVIAADLRSHIISTYSTDGTNTPIYKTVTYNYCEFTVEQMEQSNGNSQLVEIYDIRTYPQGSNPTKYIDGNSLIINGEQVCKIDKYTNTLSIKNTNTTGNAIGIYIRARAITSINRSVYVILNPISEGGLE